ncbi:Hypothetical predicted protein, partial [Mytilus galloprovincialis]
IYRETFVFIESTLHNIYREVRTQNTSVLRKDEIDKLHSGPLMFPSNYTTQIDLENNSFNLCNHAWSCDTFRLEINDLYHGKGKK